MVETESRSIQHAAVDWNDTSCLITYGPLPDKLTHSIQAVGLLQKPLLQRKNGGLLRIICGSRRLAICRRLGLEPVACEVLRSSLPPEKCLRLAIYDNIAQRALNPVEKSLALTKMADYLNQPELMQEFMPLLDLEPSEAIFSRYTKLLDLDEVILAAIAKGALHQRIGFVLSSLAQRDRLALFHLFAELPFSVSVQEEIVETVVEIARRDKLAPAQVLAKEEVDGLRGTHKRPARQRAQDIRKKLLALRAPRLTFRRERFAREVAELGLPTGVRLVPPPYFEGPGWSLQCNFERAEDLATRLRRVAKLAEQPEFQQIMESK